MYIYIFTSPAWCKEIPWCNGLFVQECEMDIGKLWINNGGDSDSLFWHMRPANVCACVRVNVSVCVRVSRRMYAVVREREREGKRDEERECVCDSMRVCMLMTLCVCWWVCACVRARACMRVCGWVCACVYGRGVRASAHVPVCVCVCVCLCVWESLRICVRCVSVYVHECICECVCVFVDSVGREGAVGWCSAKHEQQKIAKSDSFNLRYDRDNAPSNHVILHVQNRHRLLHTTSTRQLDQISPQKKTNDIRIYIYEKPPQKESSDVTHWICMRKGYEHDYEVATIFRREKWSWLLCRTRLCHTLCLSLCLSLCLLFFLKKSTHCTVCGSFSKRDLTVRSLSAKSHTQTNLVIKRALLVKTIMRNGQDSCAKKPFHHEAKDEVLSHIHRFTFESRI